MVDLLLEPSLDGLSAVSPDGPPDSRLVERYWMLKRDEAYHDCGADWHRRRDDEAQTRRLVAQLKRLGHTVIINPAA